jgi:DHA1 family multidrug resistance protein-like MFS transporter
MRARRVRKPVLLLSISLLFNTALIVTTFSMIFYARDRFQASATLIGWLAAVPHLCYFCGCFALRPLYRLLLPRYSLILATAAAAALLAGMLVVRSVPLLFVLYGLFGFSLSLFWPPLMGWLSFGREERELNTTLGRFNLSWSGGYIIAPAVAGLLLQLGIGVPFRAAALIMSAICLAVLLASLAVAGIRQDQQREPIRRRTEKLEDRSTPLRYPAWIGLFATYVILGITMSIFPLYLREEIGLAETRIGLLLLIRALFSTLGFILLSRLSFWHFNSRLMILAQGMIAAGAAMLAVLSTFCGFAVVLAAFGLLFALSYNNSLFHGVSGSLRRSARMAVHEGLLTAGMVAGSAIGGILYQSGRFVWVLCFGCAVVAAAAATQAVLVLFYQKLSTNSAD